MGWRVTVRKRTLDPDGWRKPRTQTLDVDTLEQLAAMIGADMEDVIYVIAQPVGGQLQQWQEATLKPEGVVS